MEKLIGMTDFVLNGQETADYIKLYNGCFKYAKFLKQPLELSMFVPCDKDGNVLEEPDADYYMNVTEKELKEYQEAKERVLFKDIECIKAKHSECYSIVRISKSMSVINYPKFWTNNIIEDLIKYNLKLTESAKKQIGL